MTAAALSTIRRPRLGTVSARAGGEGGQDEGGGCEGKGERGGEGRVSVTSRLGGRCVQNVRLKITSHYDFKN